MSIKTTSDKILFEIVITCPLEIIPRGLSENWDLVKKKRPQGNVNNIQRERKRKREQNSSKNVVLNEKCSCRAVGRLNDGESCWLWIMSRINVMLQWPWLILRCAKSPNKFDYRRSEWQAVLLWSCLFETWRLLLRFQAILWW